MVRELLPKTATSKLHAKLGSEKAFHVWVKYNHYKGALIAKNVIDIARTEFTNADNAMCNSIVYNF